MRVVAVCARIPAQRYTTSRPLASGPVHSPSLVHREKQKKRAASLPISHSMPRDLPGFYWDQHRNRYFPTPSKPPPQAQPSSQLVPPSPPSPIPSTTIWQASETLRSSQSRSHQRRAVQSGAFFFFDRHLSVSRPALATSSAQDSQLPLVRTRPTYTRLAPSRPSPCVLPICCDICLISPCPSDSHSRFRSRQLDRRRPGLDLHQPTTQRQPR